MSKDLPGFRLLSGHCERRKSTEIAKLRVVLVGCPAAARTAAALGCWTRSHGIHPTYVNTKIAH